MLRMPAIAAFALAFASPHGAAQPPSACGPAAEIAYREGAPRDRVEIANRSLPGWSVLSAEIGLSGSAGRLVFDTEPGGGGINVSQPFRGLVDPSGGPRLAGEPDVADGAERLGLAFAGFAPGTRFAFTIDLDDRVSGRGGTQVSGGEIAGARLTVRFGHEDGGEETHSGLFGPDGRARAAAPCVS